MFLLNILMKLREYVLPNFTFVAPRDWDVVYGENFVEVYSPEGLAYFLALRLDNCSMDDFLKLFPSFKGFKREGDNFIVVDEVFEGKAGLKLLGKTCVGWIYYTYKGHLREFESCFKTVVKTFRLTFPWYMGII